MKLFCLYSTSGRQAHRRCMPCRPETATRSPPETIWDSEPLIASKQNIKALKTSLLHCHSKLAEENHGQAVWQQGS